MLGAMKSSSRSRMAAFTLIEVMIVVALVAIVLSLAGPSFSEYILVQRLRSVQAALLTDLSYARSEAISRGTFVQVKFQNSSTESCYIIYSRSNADTSTTCDCTQPAGSRCSTGMTEIKTVSLPSNNQVQVGVPSGQSDLLTIDSRTGGTNMVSVTEALNISNFLVETQIDSARRFRTSMTPQGRLQVCAPTGSTVGGVAC